MTKLSAAVKKVVDAFTIAGRNPDYHNHQKRLLQRNWKPLYDAVSELVQKSKYVEPIDVVLHCPVCKLQHVDRAEPDTCQTCGYSKADHELDSFKAEAMCVRFLPWLNDPHKSHRCKPEDGGCNTVFRPADVPTNGIERPETTGSSDTWKP